MSWRTVVIAKRCKLDLKMGYMVIRGEETRRIFMDEIAVVILENPAISFTGCLMNAFVEKKIRLILCGNDRLPVAELTPCYGSYDCSGKLKKQIQWTEKAKDEVWRKVVGDKIQKQAELLAENKHQKEALLLESYLPQIEFQDKTNREGHAAKVYFNALFGMDFVRSKQDPRNAALNYGYGILLAAFSREICANGYLTQLGIHHDNVLNHYNLSSDLMEPFRVLMDRAVIQIGGRQFSKEERYFLVNILNETVSIAGTAQTVLNAIKIYVRSALSALNDGDAEQIQLYQI